MPDGSDKESRSVATARSARWLLASGERRCDLASPDCPGGVRREPSAAISANTCRSRRLGAGGDTDATIQWRHARHAHEDALRDETIEHAPGVRTVAPAVDRHEVGRRGQWHKAIRARDRADRLPRAGNLLDDGRKIRLVVERRQGIGTLGMRTTSAAIAAISDTLLAPCNTSQCCPFIRPEPAPRSPIPVPPSPAADPASPASGRDDGADRRMQRVRRSQRQGRNAAREHLPAGQLRRLDIDRLGPDVPPRIEIGQSCLSILPRDQVCSNQSEQGRSNLRGSKFTYAESTVVMLEKRVDGRTARFSDQRSQPAP